MLILCLAGLLIAGCGPGKPQTPLHAAVQQGNYPAVRAHIASGSDLNARDAAGWAPLHLAVIKGDLAMVQLLAEGGADLRRTGVEGRTPIEVARERGQAAIVQFLATELQVQVQPPAQERRGRRLIDGGVGVSDVLDAW